ncbi:MAG: hypothetical protein ACE5EX_07460, partial [Phycisphaerae bacterium]
MEPCEASPVAEGTATWPYSRFQGRQVFAATWRPNKGILDLVRAFEDLAARHPHLELILLGTGVPEATVRAAFRPQTRPRVRWRQTT